MKKRFALIILSIAMLLLSIGLVSCAQTKYKIYFMNGQDVVSIKQTAGYESIALPLTPTREGYSFEGWYFDDGVWEQPFTANHYVEKEITADVTLYAHFIEAHAHTYTFEETQPTCTENGSKVFTCSCGDTYTEVLTAAGHSEKIITGTPATCTQKGLSDGKICTVCGEVLVAQQEIEATGHNSAQIVKEATCTEQGYTLNVCLCGYSFIDNYVEPLGHLEAIRQKVYPTCTELGYNEGKYCSRCEITLIEQTAIPALGHDEVVVLGTSATCTQNGLTDGAKCSVCEEVLAVQSSIPATGHLEGRLAPREATCALEGLTEGVGCYVCGEVLVAQSTIEKLPHVEQTIEGYDATCTSNGLTDLVKCTVCGEVISSAEVIEALGHTEVVLQGSPAACTENGLSDGLKCSVCDVVLTLQTEILATGHDYQAAVTSATCTEGGYTTHTCANCNDSYIDTFVEATGHTQVVVPAVAPTCTEDGLTEGSKCATCDIVYVEQEVVDALGHTEEVIPSIAPTCTKDGLTEGLKCSVCGDILTAQQVDSATGHGYGEQATLPTCTSQGYTTYTCSSCNDVYISNYVAPLGHSFINYVDQGDGTEKAVCERVCGVIDIRTLDQYTVQFNANGGSTPQPINVDRDTAYGALPTSTKTGYTFLGWYTSQNEGDKKEATDIVTASHTLYAYWEPLTFNVSFDSNGGSLVNDKTVTFGKSYDTLILPTKTGYTFTGWYNAEAGGEKITSATLVTVVADHTLYARWQLDIICTIDFTVDGASIGTKEVKNGDVYGQLLTAPEKEGYTFIGWYTSSASGSKITEDTIVTVTSNQTLYARFRANTYQVTFSGNGNTWIEPIEVTFGQSYGQLAVPAKEGYTFIGWYTEQEGGSIVISSTKVTIAGDHVLYSHWQAQTCTLSFNSNGGSYVGNMTVTYGSNYGDLPMPTKTGYIFGGWFTELEGGSKITSTSVVSTIENHTLYAHWSTTAYTVTFNANGGTSVDSITVMENDAYGSLPQTTREGYIFLGWYTALEQGTKVTSSTQVTSNHTLYAHWQAITYTITFNSNGGSDVSSKQYNYGDTYGTLNTPTKTGYSFDGWFTALEGGVEIASTDTVTSSRTLFAHWTESGYTVTFNSNGGSDVDEKLYNVGEAYGSLTTPTKTGYNFDGWYTALEGGSKIMGTEIVTSNHTLYARWTAITYTVIFESNGGSAVASKVYSYGDTYGSLTTPTKEGYAFSYWSTAQTGGSAINTSQVVAYSHTLYAYYTANEYTVYFNSDGGSAVLSKQVTFGSTYGELTAPTKNGYVFGGWFTDTTYSTKITSSSTVTITSSVTLVAKWTKINASGGINADNDYGFIVS